MVAEYVVVQAVSAGSVIQPEIEETREARVVASLYVSVHPEAVGSVMQLFSVVTSVLSVETLVAMAGIVLAPL